MADPYKVLGVDRKAGQDEIRKAYRGLAKENHPDLHPGDAAREKRFKEVSAAYDIIGDADKRARFDKGEIDESGAERPAHEFYRPYADADPGFKYRGQTRFDDFGDLGGVFADLFARGGGRVKMRGADVSCVLAVDFLEAANAARKRVQMHDGKALEVKLPPGVRDGQVIRLRGQGHPGVGGGQSGDALVEVHIRPHAAFQREGDNIRTIVPVTLKEALVGSRLRVETAAGPVTVTVPKKSNTGRVLRLRGKGAMRAATGGRGDHLVELRVVLPDAPDAELVDLVASWESKHPYDPRKTRGPGA